MLDKNTMASWHVDGLTDSTNFDFRFDLLRIRAINIYNKQYNNVLHKVSIP